MRGVPVIGNVLGVASTRRPCRGAARIAVLAILPLRALPMPALPKGPNSKSKATLAVLIGAVRMCSDDGDQ